MARKGYGAVLLVPIFLLFVGGFISVGVWGDTQGKADVGYYLNSPSMLYLNPSNGYNFSVQGYVKNPGGGVATINIVITTSDGATVCGATACSQNNVRVDQNSGFEYYTFNINVPQNVTKFSINMQLTKVGSFLDFGNTFGQISTDGAINYTYTLLYPGTYQQSSSHK